MLQDRSGATPLCYGATPLCYALYSLRVEVDYALLTMLAVVNRDALSVRNERGRLPLHEAFCPGWMRKGPMAIQWLIDAYPLPSRRATTTERLG
jgi:hypothetical protein